MPSAVHPETLIIPGLAGSPEGHWQYLWAEERPNARYVHQASFDYPDRLAWIARLEEELMRGQGAYLVAHSLGCILVANMVSSRALERIRGALLVAPCDLDETAVIHPGLIRFEGMPDAPLPFPSTLVASRDDPYMSADRAAHFAAAWGARLVDMGYVGHINLASGFGRFNKGYRLFDELVLRADGAISVPAAASGWAGGPPQQVQPV